MQFISVYVKEGQEDPKAAGLLADIREFLNIDSVETLKAVKKYYLEGVSQKEAEQIAKALFIEDVWLKGKYNEAMFTDQDKSVEVAYRPGVMNPEVSSIMEAVKDMGITSLTAADSCYEYFLYGKNITDQELEKITNKILMNKTVEEVRGQTPETLLIEGETPAIETIPVRNLNDDELMSLSEDKLFLNLEEMKVIQTYFKKIDRDPTDGEVETLAQTWSEHCGHKTFKAKLIIDGKEKEPLYTRLKNATKSINSPSVISCFKDNSGVIELDEEWGLCAKVETHNSPSAIEPYGGAATGSGGVFRDIVGTGKGAKVVASTDIFCLGMPDQDPSEIPEGCLHPRYILKRVVSGVRDYGNRMGIPTNNGSLHFHPDYRAKPSIIVGSYGLIKRDKAEKGTPLKGDLVIAAGGKTGRDGIHGATFSSGAMTAKTGQINASAVQIGNAIEEKRTFDAILEISEKGYISAMTDCGAGGFSSAVGEMGEEVGARIDLEKAPTKYTGLAPWEIWVSESQERMVLAVDPKNQEAVQKIFKKYNVESVVIGEFTGDAHLHVNYNGESVVDLEMDFLHNGLPQRVMTGTWTSPTIEEPKVDSLDKLEDTLKKVMSHLNVCSKEAIYRQYDHNIQGTSVVAPYSGKSFKSPNDGAVMEVIPGSGKGLAISNGLNPVLNKIDPYYGSLGAVIEAVSNLIALGVNPKKVALIDNFIWPFPEEQELAELDRSIDAIVEASLTFNMPFVSGKDSLSSTYKKKDGSKIKIPPTLCVSAFAPVADITKTITSTFKKEGNKILVVGQTRQDLGGSVYYDLNGHLGQSISKPNLKIVYKTYEAMYQGINQGLIKSAHDVSEGGIGAALTEMTFGEKLGCRVDLDLAPGCKEVKSADVAIFSETAGRFVIEVAEKDIDKLKEVFAEVEIAEVGEITKDFEVKINYDRYTKIDSSGEALLTAFENPMRQIFGAY